MKEWSAEGELNAYRLLGISITEEDIKKEMLRLKAERSKFASKKLLKAKATLNLIYQRNTNERT